MSEGTAGLIVGVILSSFFWLLIVIPEVVKNMRKKAEKNGAGVYYLGKTSRAKWWKWNNDEFTAD